MALALLISPLTAAAAFATASLAFSTLSRLQAALPLLIGAALYCPLHFCLPRNRFFYVLAHELSHALAAMAYGVKIRKINVKKTGGYVAMNSTNTFISLAPYFIPFYALAAGLSYGLAAFFREMSPYRPLFTGATGFFLAFHLLNTGEILTGPVQSDLKKAGGVFFSISMVLLLNSLCLALALKLIFPELVSLRNYAAGVWNGTGAITGWLYAAASLLLKSFRETT
jgi:hypothetical protein